MVHGKVGALGGWFSEPPDKEFDGRLRRRIKRSNYVPENQRRNRSGLLPAEFF